MSSTPRTGRSSIATTRSSARRPAAAAGEAGATSTTSTPRSRPTAAATRGGSGRVPPAMPIQARRTRPSRISAEMTPRVVALMGIGEPEPDAGDRGVDADDAAVAVDQRAAGVAGVERGVGLDDVVDDPRRLARAGRQRAAERGHDAGGDRAGEAVRVADRHDELADAQRGGVAELGRRVRLAVGAQHGEVGERVGPHHARLDLAAVGERRANRAAARAGSRRRGRR